MSNHITEDIPRLLTGEANRDAVLDAAEHLRSCPDCQQELVSAVVAHASLTSAYRFAPEIVVSPPSGDDGPGDEQRGDVLLAGEHAAPSTETLPPMTDVFAKVREEAEVTARKQARAPKRRRLLAVAAAAIVLTGGGVTIAEVATSSAHQSTHSVALTAFDRGTHSATVEILGDRTLRINASKLPRLDSSHVYELWLTDAAREHMQSVGVLGNDNKADFTVSPKVLSQYRDLEVSVQRINQTTYSGISVLRGSYT